MGCQCAAGCADRCKNAGPREELGHLKHDLSNSFTILSGLLERLKRTIASDSEPLMGRISERLVVIEGQIRKLDEIRDKLNMQK